MRIAFQTYAGEGWKAGDTCLTSLMRGLRALGDASLELAFVVWEGTPEAWYRTVLPDADKRIAAPYAPPPKSELAHLDSVRRHLVWWFKKTLFKTSPAREDLFRSDVLQRHAVDCSFSLPLERRTDFGVPLIIWIPDLQHLHLADLFPPAERAKRDRFYLREMESATLIMVTAEAVRQDLESFAPTHAAKARVLPLVVPVPSAVYDQDPRWLSSTYHLPEKFFWLPNQFWKHKNHIGVLEALRILRERSVYPCVVCAGNPFDHRDPLHFADLLRQMSRWNLRDQFIVLGMLPHEEVLMLMRQAICILNPSLFEGFGFSVAESRSVGKRALLSDLPAHREQDPPGAMYFDPRDARDLADQMEMIWKTAEPGPDLALEAAARAELPKRQQEFGRAFLRLAEEAVMLWENKDKAVSQSPARPPGLPRSWQAG